jgi:hypothetical protein
MIGGSHDSRWNRGALPANDSPNQQKRPNRLTGAFSSNMKYWRVYSIA